jgi:hypothetical protein
MCLYCQSFQRQFNIPLKQKITLMKKSLLFLFSGLVILASSCQRKEYGSFQKSNVVSYAQPKKTQATPVQEVVATPSTEVATASIVESQNVTSTSVLDKAVAENNTIANNTQEKVYSFKGVKVNSKAEFLSLNSSKIKEATGKSLTFKEKFVLKAAQKQVAKGKSVPVDGDKSWVAALLICLFLGGIGIHRFYLGYTWQGIVQLLTFGGLGLWTLIDLVRIIIKDLEPKDGSYN